MEQGESFVLEAGAGAGKTYTLVKALRHLILRVGHVFSRTRRKIACITFTRVARDEIVARTDRSPLVFCETTHAFAWALMAGFQKQMRSALEGMPGWVELIAERGALGERRVEYDLGHRSFGDSTVGLHHDDVLRLFVALLEYEKFRRVLVSQYPYILIDEYQDTDSKLMAAISRHFLGRKEGPVFGFFGDHWQKIYGDGCGAIHHHALKRIGKGANFRSVPTIIDCLNRMRPELVQMAKDPAEIGEVRVFHTNTWTGQRRKGAHWGGDLPADEARRAFSAVNNVLRNNGWDFSPSKTKVLMLTHRILAHEQGYESLPEVFRYNDSFVKKENRYIEFLVDVVEPAYEAFESRRYGAMFEALNMKMPGVKNRDDKSGWQRSMNSLGLLRGNGTVGDVIDHLRATRLPRLSDSIERREAELDRFVSHEDEGLSKDLLELRRLRKVRYAEIVSLAQYLRGFSPFETKHGVKGAEFENVVVVVGRGWNAYNFVRMLECSMSPEGISEGDRRSYEANRNLFYVACSRPRRRLAVLFTQELSDAAFRALGRWFGFDAIQAVEF
ncbi:UvrD-helicase domain-containing protein [Myxococcus sp. AB036A]|uniref:UvrD-helicase domain-containing protein n=1 Tax=Myxococcus sp. AB036A TaxID=2562793 RepID=UPI001E4EF787|nr:UvrD-helicase domain-containing protein [Myxococcus sp. AB036A]